MRPLLGVPARLRLTGSAFVVLGVATLVSIAFVAPVGALSGPTDEVGRCDLDPRFGGSVAVRVDHGFEFLATVGNPIIGSDGLTYASFDEAVLPDPEHPLGQQRLSVIRFGGDGKMDRTDGDNGFARLPLAGGIVSMAEVDGEIVGLTSGFFADHETAIFRLNESGELDRRFGDGGVVSLGVDLASLNNGLTGVVGQQKTDVFSYDEGSSVLTYLQVDHRGGVREIAETEIRLGHLLGAHGGPDGRVLLTVFAAVDEEETNHPVPHQSIGGLASVVSVPYPTLGRDGDGLWLWFGSDDHSAGVLASVGLDGVLVRSSPVSLGSGQLAGRVESIATLPSGEIVFLAVDRSQGSGPDGTLYRYPNFAALSQGLFTAVEINLNTPDTLSPGTALLVDQEGGVRVFSGAVGSSIGHVSQARLLARPVLLPRAGAMLDQMDRLYGAAFGRDADTAGLDYWLDQRANGFSALSIAALFTESPEFRSTYNDPDQAGFVEILYGNVLGRHSDAEGLAYWTGRLTSDDLTRAQVLLAFSDSPEFVTKTQSLAPSEPPWSAVSRLYETAFARSPDRDGFCYFVAELQDGHSLSWVAQQMAQSVEFVNRHDGTNASFVSALYRGAFDRQPEGNELSYWVAQLEAGTIRSAVILQISASPEAVRALRY